MLVINKYNIPQSLHASIKWHGSFCNFDAGKLFSIYPLSLIIVDILPQTAKFYWKFSTMHIEKLKLFLYGLPPDCQGSTLKDLVKGNVLASYGKRGYLREGVLQAFLYYVVVWLIILFVPTYWKVRLPLILKSCCVNILWNKLYHH